MHRTAARSVLAAATTVAAAVVLAGPAAAAPADVDLHLADPQDRSQTVTVPGVANLYEQAMTVLLCDTLDDADGDVPYVFRGYYGGITEDGQVTDAGFWATPVVRDDVSFGRASDEPLCGAWGLADGAVAQDTFAVRRGNQFFLSTEPTVEAGGRAAVSFRFGRATDQALVGDWDGDGVDTVAVRRGNVVFFASDDVDGGGSVRTSSYGRATDVAVAGDFTDEGRDTVAVRRGNTYLVSAGEPGGSLSTALTFSYGRTTDLPIAGAPSRDAGAYLGVARVKP